VPGALGFTRHAAERGVAVFYVTNRRSAVEDATRANLRALGFPLDGSVDTVLTRGENDWDGSDKTARRDRVGESYRVLLLVGDNLEDFVNVGPLSLEARESVVERYREYWGDRWFVLPNPQYGSWEGALFGFDYALSERQELDRKRGRLRTR
jgi:acid phosphatase